MQDFFVKDIIEACNGLLLSGDKDVRVDTVSTDSNTITENCIFVPIIGERVDAHQFIDSAIRNGAVAVLTSEHDYIDDIETIPYIRVSNTTMALQEIGKYYGKRMNIPKIGITGSVGKTTTKEMIACVLASNYKTFKTAGNNNSQIGVPLTLLKMSYEDEVAVIEMGMSMKGEIARLSKLVDLNDAVITDIGMSHIGQLFSQDGICMEKFHIADALKEDGTVFLNGDDEVLLKHSNGLKNRVISFGLNANNDYRAINIRTDNNKVLFDVIFPNTKMYPVELNVLGIHNVRNALAAIAVADKYGINPSKSIAALKDFNGIRNKKQISIESGVTVIDDSYSANPDSLMAGVEVLCSVNSSGRRVAVIGDMHEIGSKSDEYYRLYGQKIGAMVDEIVLIGDKMGSIGIGARENGNSHIAVFGNKDDLNEYLLQTINKNDAVLFKGSRAMKLNECVDYFRQMKGQNQ